MYRCSVCCELSRPCEPMRRIVVLRADGTIARERPCCGRCHTLMTRGRTEAELLKEFGDAPPVRQPPPSYAPRPRTDLPLPPSRTVYPTAPTPLPVRRITFGA